MAITKAKLRPRILIASVALLAFLSANAAQEAPRNHTNPPSTTSQTNQADMQMMQQMDTMAKSMTSMADMSRMMMENEMKGAPLKMVALAILATLGTTVLALFVVLEIQWIRFWSFRIKTERLKLTAAKS